jgi:hypothetical protein
MANTKRSSSNLLLTLVLALAGCAWIGPSQQEIITLEIAPRLVDCTGVGPQRCMQTRRPTEQTWTNFYDAISGFEYQEGFRYLIRVERTRVENPVADQSGYSWRLLAILEKVAEP